MYGARSGPPAEQPDRPAERGEERHPGQVGTRAARPRDGCAGGEHDRRDDRRPQEHELHEHDDDQPPVPENSGVQSVLSPSWTAGTVSARRAPLQPARRRTSRPATATRARKWPPPTRGRAPSRRPRSAWSGPVPHPDPPRRRHPMSVAPPAARGPRPAPSGSHRAAPHDVTRTSGASRGHRR